MRAVPLTLALTLTLTLVSPVLVFAQQARDPAPAAVLFEQALSAFEQGRTDEACTKFEDSLRLEAAHGTLINLARCHERQGKTASAWAEYTEVATLAARAGNHERARVARAASERLEATIPRLRIQVKDDIEGLEILRDGILLSERAWSQPLPIDPGRHRIDARAPGHRPFATYIDLAPTAGEVVIAIPPLSSTVTDDAIDSAPPQKVATPASASQAPRPALIAGIVLGSVGVSSLLAGAVLGAISLSDLSTAEDEPSLCPQQACSPAGRAWVDAAETKGNASTGLFVAGGLLAGAGIVFVTVELTTASDESARQVAVAPLIGPDNAGLSARFSW